MAYTADKALYLNKDRSKVVEAGSEDAAFLLAAEGQTVPDAEAKRLGLGENKKVEGAPENKGLAPSSASPVAGATPPASPGPAAPPKDNTLSSASFKPAAKPAK